jgi:cytoskeleton protein RodZ
VTENGRPVFDERAALAELERLREQTVHLRSKRVAASAEFDAFIRSFKTRQTDPDSPPAAPSADFSPMTVPSELDATPLEPSPPPPLEHQPAPPALAPRRRPSARNLVLGSALLVLATGGVVTWTLRNGGRESTEPTASGPPPPRSEPDATPAAPRPVPVSPYDSEIITTRPVWVRIVADGQRVVERELPAQARVPFKATRSIVIRTGDAGAIRLSIGGVDHGPLGADGVVVTRTFSVPDPSTQ